eukprot:336442-Chlamydomonas_euryale.AAC.6
MHGCMQMRCAVDPLALFCTGLSSHCLDPALRPSLALTHTDTHTYTQRPPSRPFLDLRLIPGPI